MAEAYRLDAPYLWAALVALVIVLSIWVVVLQARLNRLLDRYSRLFSGTTFGSFEDAMDRYVTRLEDTVVQVDALTQLCQTVESNLLGTIQRIGIVRFNPFSDTGSDQSFAVALLDGNGSGIVLSSLFSRTSTRMFAKAIVEGKSNHPLTDEELEAIEQAIKSRPVYSTPAPG